MNQLFSCLCRSRDSCGHVRPRSGLSLRSVYERLSFDIKQKKKIAGAFHLSADESMQVDTLFPMYSLGQDAGYE